MSDEARDAALDEIPVEDDPSIVYDEDALAAAERAAREAPSPLDTVDECASSSHIDEPWVRIATAPLMDPARTLEYAHTLLTEAGIDSGFDPYRPGLAVSPYPTQRPVHLVVPASAERRARDLLDEAGVELSAPEPRDPRLLVNAAPPFPLSDGPIVKPTWRRTVGRVLAAIVVLGALIELLLFLRRG